MRGLLLRMKGRTKIIRDIMKCPYCKRDIAFENNKCICRCGRTYVLNKSGAKITYADITTFDIAERVYVTNKEHDMFLEMGMVVSKKKNNNFYRIKLISVDKKLHGCCLWMPSHWLACLPEELRQCTKRTNEPK